MEFKDILSTIKRDEHTIINDITTFNYNDNGTLSRKTRVAGKLFTETKCNYDDADKLSEIVSTSYEGKGMKRSPLGVDKTVYKYDGDNLKNITSYVHLEGKDEYIANTLDYKDNGDETYKSFNEDGSVSTDKFTKIINKDGIAKEITTIKYESAGTISEKNKETFYDDGTYTIESKSQNVSTERTIKPDDKYHITLSQSKVENPNATMHISETIEPIDDTHYKFTTAKKNMTGNNIISINEITTYEIINDIYHVPIGKKVNVLSNFNNGTNNISKAKAKTYVDDNVSVIAHNNILVSSKLGNNKVVYETTGAFYYDYAIHTEDESTVYNIYYKSGNVVSAYVSNLKDEDNIYDIKLSKSGMSENWIIDCTISHNDNITTTYNATVSKDTVTDILDLVLACVADNLKDKLNIDISLSIIDQTYTPILIAGNFDDLNTKLS